MSTSAEPIEPTCPPTYHLDKSICKCVKDTIEPHQCAPFHHWDESLQKCIPDLEPAICPPNHHLENGVCVPDVTPPPPPDQPVLKLQFPRIIEMLKTGTIDASQSTADSIVVTQTAGANSNLQETTEKWKWNFTPPDAPVTTITVEAGTKAVSGYSIGFKAVAKKGTSTSTTQVTIAVSKSGPPPPEGEFDENGVQMLHKTTGQFVDQKVGGDPAGNGQRYSCNHKYQNYMLIGYWKTGPNQELIEHKTDGPNHGSCTQLPKCCWTEPAIELKDGKSHISSEWPHPKNHPAASAPSAVTLGMNLNNKWIGYAVVAYQDGEFRTIEQWCDTSGLNAQGKPSNNWQLVLKETDKGQITNPELAKRKMFVEGRGMESEIRMHGDTGKHGTTTDMKFARVYEIVNPTTS